MKTLSIIRKNYQIFVTPIKFCDLDKNRCSKGFLAHKVKAFVNNPEIYVFVKCDIDGVLDYRGKRGEYRIYEVHKHEIITSLM